MLRRADQRQGLIERLLLGRSDTAGSDLLISIADEDEDAIKSKGDDLTLQEQLGGLIQMREVAVIEQLCLVHLLLLAVREWSGLCRPADYYLSWRLAPYAA